VNEQERKEMMAALEAVRTAVNAKNVEALERLDKIEAKMTEADASAKDLRGQIDLVRQADDERTKAIEKLQREARLERAADRGPQSREQALAVFGAQCRQMLCRHVNSEIPTAFRGEVELIRSYQELQRATLNADATGGSYLVPQVTESQVIEGIEEVSDILSLVDFMPGLPPASKIIVPVLTGRPTLQVKRSTIDTNMTASDPTIGQLELEPDEAYIYFPIDNRLMQMSAVSLGTMMMNLLRDSAIQGMVNWLLLGDGTSSYNEVVGILNSHEDYTVVLPSGKLLYNDATANDARRVKKATLKRGRGPRGRWLMAEDVLGVFEDLDRTGKTKVVDFRDDGTATLLRNPVIFDEGMPDLSTAAQTDTIFAAFGDLATYVVGLVGGIQTAVSTEYLFGRNQTAMRAVLNLAIKRKPVKTLTALATAAQ
jgi:HK97 family phage major capsid protein